MHSQQKVPHLGVVLPSLDGFFQRASTKCSVMIYCTLNIARHMLRIILLQLYLKYIYIHCIYIYIYIYITYFFTYPVALNTLEMTGIIYQYVMGKT